MSRVLDPSRRESLRLPAPTMVRRLLFVSLGLFYLLHNDLWLWRDGRLFGGLPVGLLYHVLYCFAASGVMWLLVRFAWPAGIDEES